jgi:serine/threonine-protein kinase
MSVAVAVHKVSPAAVIVPQVAPERYRRQSRIAQGGWSEVWKAEDLDNGQQVALKFLAPELTHDQYTHQRFRLEAAYGSGIKSRRVVKTIGFIDGRRPIIVCEYAGRRTLRHQIERQPPDLQLAARFGMEMAEALTAVHYYGLVHRDVSPKNFMIGDDGRLRLGDFGIALNLRTGRSPRWYPMHWDRPAVSSGCTTTGSFVGTLGYISPEQIRQEPVDSRADIYGAGVILYELAASQRPFQAEGEELLRAHRSEEPISLDGVLPEPWVRLIATAMHKDPDQRFQTAEQLRQALEGVTG